MLRSAGKLAVMGNEYGDDSARCIVRAHGCATWKRMQSDAELGPIALYGMLHRASDRTTTSERYQDPLFEDTAWARIQNEPDEARRCVSMTHNHIWISNTHESTLPLREQRARRKHHANCMTFAGNLAANMWACTCQTRRLLRRSDRPEFDWRFHLRSCLVHAPGCGTHAAFGCTASAIAHDGAPSRPTPRQNDAFQVPPCRNAPVRTL